MGARIRPRKGKNTSPTSVELAKSLRPSISVVQKGGGVRCGQFFGSAVASIQIPKTVSKVSRAVGEAGLLGAPRSSIRIAFVSLLTRLRSYEKFPRLYTRTKRHRSFVQYALSHYQDRVYNDWTYHIDRSVFYSPPSLPLHTHDRNKNY